MAAKGERLAPAAAIRLAASRIEHLHTRNDATLKHQQLPTSNSLDWRCCCSRGRSLLMHQYFFFFSSLAITPSCGHVCGSRLIVFESIAHGSDCDGVVIALFLFTYFCLLQRLELCPQESAREIKIKKNQAKHIWKHFDSLFKRENKHHVPKQKSQKQTSFCSKQRQIRKVGIFLI